MVTTKPFLHALSLTIATSTKYFCSLQSKTGKRKAIGCEGKSNKKNTSSLPFLHPAPNNGPGPTKERTEALGERSGRLFDEDNIFFFF